MSDQASKDELRQEAFLGAVDDQDELEWFVSPRSLLGQTSTDTSAGSDQTRMPSSSPNRPGQNS
jgi:hypothetical protein